MCIDPKIIGDIVGMMPGFFMCLIIHILDIYNHGY